MFAHTLKYELLVLRRNKRARIFTLVFPLVLLVVLSSVGGDETTTFGGADVSLARFFLPGVLTMSVVSACFASLVMSVVTRRHDGILQRRRATPVTAGTLLSAQTTATVGLAVVSAVVLLVVGKVAFGVGLSAGALAAVAITFVLGAAACCALAFLVSGVVPSPDTTQPVVQLVMFPVLFVSGIWFTTDDFPGWLTALGDALPVKHLADALHQAAAAGSFSDAISLGDLGALAAWAVVAGVLATRRFAWAPSAATA